MISDLELVGDEAQPPPGGTPGSGSGSGAGRDSGSGTVIGDDGVRDVSGRFRPWLWALGGAVAASAVWGAWAYAESQAEPDLRGYRVSRDLCDDAKLSALSAAYGERRESGSHRVDERAEVDHAVCSVDLVRPPKGESFASEYASVDLAYIRHKVTDPEPEFDASVTAPKAWHVTDNKARRIADLGERAYLLSEVDGEGKELRVLDGQIELSLVLNGVVVGQEDPVTGEMIVPDGIDFEGIEPSMIEDMRDLMATLKK
ncbi:hypothetical protein OG349_12745 [Streptomyces sp. NBC_01317]|uniref:hypothetical protein n=1 Tax=Streptomyces sp. NBC_01317 TaxID=2903822 RepID=UPI002E0F922C|nr:hypothetical protein OG349_12745 [Streptomyces sp. NBC_01317]